MGKQGTQGGLGMGERQTGLTQTGRTSMLSEEAEADLSTREGKQQGEGFTKRGDKSGGREAGSHRDTKTKKDITL